MIWYTQQFFDEWFFLTEDYIFRLFSDIEEKEKVIRIDDEDYVEEDVIDLRSYSSIGPLIMVELLQLPHQAKEMNGWTIQQGRIWTCLY